jgi:hypothetical protein
MDEKAKLDKDLEGLGNALRNMEAKYTTSQTQLETAKRERLLLERRELDNGLMTSSCSYDHSGRRNIDNL